MEKEKAEKLVIAALSDNETDGVPHQNWKLNLKPHILMLEEFVGKLP